MSSSPASPRCALIVRPDSYGDLILFTPVLTALRAAWPETRICLLARRDFADLAPLLPADVNVEWLTTDIHPYHHGPADCLPAIAALGRELAGLAPDLVVAGAWTRTWLEPLVASFFPGAREVGFAGAPLADATAAELRTVCGVDAGAHFARELVAAPADLGEWEKNLLLADALLGGRAPRRRPRLRVGPETAARAAEILNGHGLGNDGQPWVACCPAGTLNIPIKAWPEERYADALVWLREVHGLPALLVGHVAERARVERVAELATARGAAPAVWLGENGELPLLAGLLARARLYFGNDTGTLHLATALDRPAVAVFGGGHRARFHPVARRAVVVLKPLPCFGCGWNCYFGDAPCVREIPLSPVIEALGRVLADAPGARGVERITAGQADENARVQVLGLVDDLGRKEAAVQGMLNDLTHKEGVSQGLREELSAKEAAIQDQLASLGKAAVTLAAVRAEADAQAAALQTEAARRQGERDEARTRADFLHERWVVGREELSETRQEAAHLRGELTAERETAAAQAKRLAGLAAWAEREAAAGIEREARLAESGTRVEELGTRVEELGARVEELDGELREAHGRLEDQGGFLREREVRITELDARARVLDERVLAFKRQTFREMATDHLWRNVSGFLRKRFANHYRRDLRGVTGRTLPKISIVTPVFNAAATLVETLESVLAQGYPDLEYIVVDGGSTDGSLEILERYRPRLSALVTEPDHGMYDAVAKGFERATGEVLGYLNADDLYEPGGLRRVGEWFRDHPRAAVVYHEDTVEVAGWRFPNVAQPPGVDFETMLAGHNLFQDGVFFRRVALEKAGGPHRGLRRAGDWELWTRLARHFAFHRAGAHNSCFRVRAGQISEDMDAYRAEQGRLTATLRAARPAWSRLRDWPAHGVRQAAAWWAAMRPRRLFFPIDFTQMPPPPGEPQPADPTRPPRCPVTGQAPTRLLFSSRDTRFGDPGIHRFYHCAETHLAVIDPPLAPETLGALYARHYSNPAPALQPPDPAFGSPYRGFRGGRWTTRLALRARLDEARARRLGVSWGDKTADELLAILRPWRSPDRQGTTFLDVGCFEGHLLDELKTRTRWQLAGLEPNAAAADAARQRGGHEVWTAPAEAAAETIPAPRNFDTIFLGQTVEHLDDPALVLRRLTTLLAPGGLLVVSTPNLDSRQIDLFGPTWSHWHPPYHRTLFSRQSLERLGRACGLETVRARSYSHPYWSGLSLELHGLGLGAAVPHGRLTPEALRPAALGLAAWSRWLWDWRGGGDYLFVVFRRERGG